MAAQEDEIKSLKEKNNELVQKVQYWKMTAAQRENEKLELMKEINELRLKLIRLKNGGAAEARKLDAALQSNTEQALAHLVEASSAVARTVALAKTYMRDREGVDTLSPRWSNISNCAEKVHRVPPMMIGGQSIQPVVSLSRATLNFNTSRQISRSPNSSRNVTVRALPMHMLQDVYIPLTRIDVRDIPSNNETAPAPAADDGGDNIPFNADMEDVAEDPQNMTDDDDYDSSRRLDIVTEDAEPESEEQTPPRARAESPLEGPSWLLDAPRRAALEPDSTTEEAPHRADSPETVAAPAPARMFTPTRRRKRAAAALAPPEPAAGAPTGAALCSRELQVLVPKLPVADASPAKRRAAPRFDAPSPNGATDSRVIVSEELESQAREMQSGEPQTPSSRDESRASPERRHGCARDRDHGSQAQENCRSHDSQGQASYRGDRRDRRDSGDSDSGSGTDPLSEGRARRNRKPVSYKENRSHDQGQESYRRDSGDSDSGSGTDLLGEGRTRRNRKPVTYKEKPLNRKLRR